MAPLIDSHAHFLHEACGRADWREVNAARFRAGDAMGITCHVASVLGTYGHRSPTYFPSPADVSLGNEAMLAICAAEPVRVRMLATVNPNFTDHALAEIEADEVGLAILKPLRRLDGASFRIAPLSVLVDPIRAERMLALATGPNFSEKVRYIYDKQLEEADLIVINKRDLLDDARLERLTAALQGRYPASEVIAISARAGAHFDDWLSRLEASLADRPAMDVDYDTYADGEALLGWLNATARVTAAAPFDGNALLERLALHVQAGLAGAAMEVAHCKMTLSPDTGTDLAVRNLVRNEAGSESIYRLADEITDGELLLNLRAEGEPDHLRALALASLERAAAELSASADVTHIEHFRPGRPQPTHRMVAP